MVAESKLWQQAGHPLLRPREAPMVGTPTQWSASSFSSSRRPNEEISSSFQRANEGEKNGSAAFVPTAKTFPFLSQHRSLRGRGRGRGGRFGPFGGMMMVPMMMPYGRGRGRGRGGRGGRGRGGGAPGSSPY